VSGKATHQSELSSTGGRRVRTGEMNLRRTGRGGRNDREACHVIKRSGRRKATFNQRLPGSQAQGYTQARLRPWVAYTPVKNRRAVCATRGPSAGAVDLMPSTRRYYCADNGAGQSTYRRKDDHVVRIGGVTAVEEGAFGTVYMTPYDMISG